MIGCGPRQVLVVPKRMVTLHCRWCRRPGDFRWSGRSLQSWQSSAVLFSRHHFRCCCSQSIHFIRVMIIILMEAAKITIHLSRTESLQWSANNLTGKIMQVVTHHASYTSVDPCSPVVVASEAKKNKHHTDIIIVPDSRKHATDRAERQQQTTIFCLYQLVPTRANALKTAYVRPARSTFWQQLRGNTESCSITEDLG